MISFRLRLRRRLRIRVGVRIRTDKFDAVLKLRPHHFTEWCLVNRIWLLFLLSEKQKTDFGDCCAMRLLEGC